MPTAVKPQSHYIQKKDIERIAKHLRMKLTNFEAKSLKIDEDNNKVLPSLPYFFLNEDNTCSIYQVRPKAYREYPHTNRKNSENQ